MRVVSFVAMLLIGAGGAHAQDSQAIEDVIGGQLQAFNQRDVQDAWQYASPTIQRLFGTPQNFGAMVERGYPMVWTNSDVRFLDLQDFDAVQVQRVLINDANGVPYLLEYQMIETAQGWRIAGVSVVPAPDVGA